MLALLLAARLGSAHFAASGPPACQRKVLEGVLELHSFMYDDAREAFVEAQKAAPCPIAFWGEAMTYDHPLWGEQDAASARAALAKIPPGATVSAMERGLIEAAQALYEQGHAAWLERLQRLHAELPGDDEVALFDALALFANSRHGKDVKRAMEAAAIALDVFERNPDHPGAAHYLIHACDSPEHAVLALKAARRYAQIAPAAAHALHMPSHIFVQLGMWSEVEQSNTAAFAASEEWVARKKLPVSRADWHSFVWLAAARLQLGRAGEVLPMIARAHKLGESRLRAVQVELAAMWLSETQDWAHAEELLDLPPLASGETWARLYLARARLEAAAVQGDDTRAAASAAEFSAAMARVAPEAELSAELGPLTAAAKLAQAHSVRDSGSINDAIARTRELADAEDREVASGPAPWTPAREELGDLLLRSHRLVEAAKEFRLALDKRPNRRHALRGLAEAQRGAEDSRSAEDAQAKPPAHAH